MLICAVLGRLPGRRARPMTAPRLATLGSSTHITSRSAWSRLWRLRTWSLRTRLVAAQLALLALVCAGIGAGTLTAWHRFLLNQLDEQVVEAGLRSAVLFPLPPPQPSSGLLQVGPGPRFLDAPGQSSGTLGAVISDGRALEAAVITQSGARQRLTEAAYSQLADAAYVRPATVDIDGLGGYRVITTPAANGDTILTGLPTSGVEHTQLSVLGILAVVVAAALTVAMLAGIFIIRRQLAPLSAVASAAQRVADSDLDHGEVQLPTLIVHVDGSARYTEVGKLGAALNRMLHRIADAMAARHASETQIRQFVADASHELRTPLAAIRGYAELAQRRRDEIPREVAHAMNRIDSEAKRMSRLVEDMLLLARLDAGRLLDHDAVDLSQLAVDAVSDAHIAGRDRQWELNLPDEPVVVVGDGARLHQVLANLLSNARVHTPPGTTVTTSLRGDRDGHVQITVADNGPGIPQDQQSDVFGRFVRGDSSRSRKAGSTGLGLAIVAAVVKAHRGSIEVHSAPGATTFTVSLPATCTGSAEGPAADLPGGRVSP